MSFGSHLAALSSPAPTPSSITSSLSTSAFGTNTAGQKESAVEEVRPGYYGCILVKLSYLINPVDLNMGHREESSKSHVMRVCSQL